MKKQQKEYHIIIKGSEMIKKKVGKSGNSGYIYVPVRWSGKEVTIILNEDVGD
jgi:putative transposon-encoded protein